MSLALIKFSMALASEEDLNVVATGQYHRLK